MTKRFDDETFRLEDIAAVVDVIQDIVSDSSFEGHCVCVCGA